MGAKTFVGGVLLVALPVLVLAVLALVLLNSVECTKVSVEEIEAKIAKDLPEGTEAEAILNWLRENDIDVQARGVAREVGYQIYPDLGIPPDATIIRARISDTGGVGVFMAKHIVIYFVLDDEDRLIDVVVEEVRIAV